MEEIDQLIEGLKVTLDAI